MASRIQVTSHFETSTPTPNDPKMSLNTKKITLPDMHITTTPEFQIYVCFALQPAVLELQAILREVHRMTTI